VRALGCSHWNVKLVSKPARRGRGALYQAVPTEPAPLVNRSQLEGRVRVGRAPLLLLPLLPLPLLPLLLLPLLLLLLMLLLLLLLVPEMRLKLELESRQLEPLELGLVLIFRFLVQLKYS